ncbi:hypothetical protein CDL12_15082 [Handroanthus impetiginosus]|uniref:Uncharacterized protein n=1 Tax=Handroanthus impetiginosus TaxID=429701 RepID=A0A2G9H463_9LAMI|nr:hypothetical protein CDL12_15082 [Handroanthus impetiginosus]
MAILKTSWTNMSPAHNCMGYANIRGQGEGQQCGFFVWVDPPICATDIVIILGLLCKFQACNKEVAFLQKRLRFMVAIVVLLIFLIFFLVDLVNDCVS